MTFSIFRVKWLCTASGKSISKQWRKICAEFRFPEPQISLQTFGSNRVTHEKTNRCLQPEPIQIVLKKVPLKTKPRENEGRYPAGLDHGG